MLVAEITKNLGLKKQSKREVIWKQNLGSLYLYINRYKLTDTNDSHDEEAKLTKVDKDTTTLIDTKFVPLKKLIGKILM